MPAAFISYCRADSDFALRLAGDLKAAGANVWLDQLDIIPGQLWDRAIEDAITNCPRMVVIVSPASVNSTNVMDEVSFALEEQKTVIPVIYRDCAIPFRLRRVEHVDLSKDYSRGLQELLKTLAIGQSLGQGESVRADADRAAARQAQAEQPIAEKSEGERLAGERPEAEHAAAQHQAEGEPQHWYRKKRKVFLLTGSGVAFLAMVYAFWMIHAITPTDPSKWPLIGEDTFTEERSGWSVGSFPDEKASRLDLKVVDGKYRWDVDYDGNYHHMVASPYGSAVNFSVAVDARFTHTGANPMTAHLIFGLTDNEEYEFYVSSSGDYCLYKSDSKEQQYKRLVNPTRVTVKYEPSAWNRMRVVVDDQLIKYYLNSELLGEYRYSSFAGGQVGLAVGTTTDRGGAGVIDFDNFEFRRKP
jgi:hypothetical protein